jgi:prepilin-type N-terminal cleavage/methylation domain-containing protein
MRGATLIELLVALVLAGIAMAGTLGALSHVQGVWRDAERLGRLHERAQYVFGALEPELQMAGYFGSYPQPQLGTASPGGILSFCGSSTVLPLKPSLSVLQGGWSLPCSPQGSGAKPGSDVLIVRRASTRITAADGALQLRGSAVDAGLRNLLVRIFYVARSADGDSRTPALRVKSLTAIAGEPAFIDTEVMPGVDDLQVELLPDELAPQTVRVRLLIRPDSADVRAKETSPALSLERRFHLRNAAS